MASTQLREAYVALLMDRFNGIRYPSSPMMDRLEAAITDRESAEAYVAALLDHVDKVRRLDTGDVPPTAHPLPLENVLRPDEVRPGLDRDEVLAAAPAVEGDRFLVPAILGEAP